MPRGGIESTRIALERISDVLGSADAAKHVLVDALRSGEVEAKGRPVIGWWTEPLADPSATDTLLRRQDTDEDLIPVLGARKDVPPEYWAGLTLTSIQEWDWERGALINSEWMDEVHDGYGEVVLKTRQVNALKNRLTHIVHSEVPEERARHSSWDTWIAVLAVLVRNEEVHSGTSQAKLLAAVAELMAEWGYSEKSESTVAPAATAVLRRFREIWPDDPS